MDFIGPTKESKRFKDEFKYAFKAALSALAEARLT